MSKRFLLPEKSMGVGFWESTSGAVTHHLVVKNYNIANYQVTSPS
ncbi:MAG: nickel-dependent hydrogenase large subunit [Acidobacteria bacterium]|nr:nickel-dependent hydrogenase large subunit [Acidobacteriota bacterium]